VRTGGLWKIFPSRREEETRGWGKLHNEYLRDFVFFNTYHYGDKLSRRKGWAEDVERMSKIRTESYTI
jgi:hypothetical protein